MNPPELDPNEERPVPRPRRTALGRDPFDAEISCEPMVARLDFLESPPQPSAPRPPPPRPVPTRPVSTQPAPTRAPDEGRPGTAERRAPLPTRKRWVTAPALAEVELPEPDGLVDHLLSERVRRVLSSLAHLTEGEGPLDRYGFSPETLRRAFPVFHALYKSWFRVTSSGHEHIPETGPVVLASNHAGLLPFDAAMSVIDVGLHSDPPRLLRAVVDRWAGSLPWINVFYARVGQVVGTPENVGDLLDQGQAVLVFPEGMAGARKTIAQRYRLQSFRVGFIEHALRARTPIVPMAVIGSDDQTPILYDIKPIAKRLGLPVAPITPSFPWFGPLGLLPYPVPYRIVYGEPLRYHERFGPEGADDARLVKYLANQVRRKVQQLVDRNR